MQINIGGTGNPRTRLRTVTNSVLDKRLASLPGVNFVFDPGAIRSLVPQQFRERVSGLVVQPQKYDELFPNPNVVNPPLFISDDPNFGYRSSVGVGATSALGTDRAIPIGGSYTYIGVLRRAPAGVTGSVLLEIVQTGTPYAAQMYWQNDRYVFTPLAYDPNAAGSTASLSSPVPLPEEAMHTVAVSFDAQTRQSRMYANGVPLGGVFTHSRAVNPTGGYLRPFSGITGIPSYPKFAGHLIRFDRALHLPEAGGTLADCHAFLKDWYGF